MEPQNNQSNRKLPAHIYLLITVLLVAFAFFVGVNAGVTQFPGSENVAGIINKDLHKEGDVDFETFWRVWNLLDEHFVGSTSTPVTDQEKVWGAISGLTASYDDPYTVFLPPRENEIFASEISGKFEGVGMEIGIRDNTLTVIAPLKGTPAERAGIKSGDRVLKIDDKSTAGMSVEEAVTLIRGKRGTVVKLSIGRNGSKEALEIPITRDKINIPIIETKIIPDTKVFVISLYNFSESSPTQFRGALREFIKAGEAKKADKLVLDLRGNPGGYLEAAISMASWFLPEGKPVVIENFTGKAEDIVHRSKGYDIFKKLKMVVLIDGGSASASEILAGALSEHGVATLVGTNSFGKGSVQRLFTITEGTSLKVTIARWLTPEGKSISDGGLAPDVEVKVTPEDVEKGRDPQMDKAVEILNKK